MIKTLLIVTTYRCDLRCAHCLQGHPSSRVDFPLELLPRLLKDARQFGAQTISLTGGEPRLHPQFETFVKTVAEAGYKWNMATNGQQSEPYLRVIEKYGENLTAVSVSLDGATAETHNAIRQHAGAFEQVQKTIRTYVEHGITVRTSTCLNAGNLHELDEIVKLGEVLGVSEMKFAGVIPAPHNVELRITDAECLTLYERIKALNRTTKVKINATSALYTQGGINFCRVLNLHSLHFNARGELVFCCDTHGYGATMGSLHEKPLPELIESWIENNAGLRAYRTQRIAQGKMGEGFDTCSFCNFYFDEIRGLIKI